MQYVHAHVGNTQCADGNTPMFMSGTMVRRLHETGAEIAEVVPLATVDVDVQVVSSHRSLEIAYQF